MTDQERGLEMAKALLGVMAEHAETSPKATACAISAFLETLTAHPVGRSIVKWVLENTKCQ